MNPQNSLTPKKGDIVAVEIGSLSQGGHGVGRLGDFVLFIPYTVPGDLVRAKITEIKKNYGQADLIEVSTPSPHRVEPKCKVFGECGGCQWQMVSYDQQLEQKTSIVRHALKRIAKQTDPQVLPVVPSPKSFSYRNRIQIRTAGEKLGFYKRQSNTLVEIDSCDISEEPLNLEIEKIKKTIKGSPDFKTSRMELMVDEKGEVHHRTNQSREYIPFRQVNSKQNLNLQNYVCELAGVPSTVDDDNIGWRGNALDLYCGDGNLSFPLLQKGWRIYGVDDNKPAIQLARERKTDRTFFSAADCVVELRKLVEKNRQFELIVLDPPRIGTDERIWPLIDKLKPKKIIYVSCDPATFSRDLARLTGVGKWRLSHVKPFDMFPQTFHVELVALIEP